VKKFRNIITSPFIFTSHLADNISPTQRHHAMRQIKSKNTTPELKVRRLLRNLGFFGYRLHLESISGKPDIVWIKRKLAVFVHGCFWHGHSCARGARIPKTNAEYWKKKIARNVDRDTDAIANLEASGWRILVIWECEIRNLEELSKRLLTFLQK